MSKTRNQRRRERAKVIVMTVAMLIMWGIVSVMMFRAWANEPTISEADHRAYIESLQGGER